MLALSIGILIFVTAQRLGELVYAKANEKQLRVQGAFEVGAEHYKYIVIMHGTWLITIWAFVLVQQPAVLTPFLLAYIFVQILRVWVLVSIGRRWTTRILIIPNEQKILRGPYRFLSHPNYVVVILEIAILPLIFGLWGVAIIWSILNAVMLTIRTRCENKAWSR